MIIDTTGNGSFLFKSLDPTDNSLYTFSQDNSAAFVPVGNLSIGTNTSNSVIKLALANNFGSNNQFLSSNGSALNWGPPGAPNGILWGYLSSLTLSCNTSALAGNNWVSVTPGECVDSTNSTYITLTSTLQKNLAAGAWVSGNNAAGMGTGVNANNTTQWFHAHLIINNGVTDLYFDTSVTAANAPTGTTAFRRIGSIIWVGSVVQAGVALAVYPFVQSGDYFHYLQSWPIINTSGSYGPALTGLATPLGIVTIPILGALQQLTAGTQNIQLGAAAGPAAGTGTLAYFMLCNSSAGINQETGCYAIGPPTDTSSRIYVYFLWGGGGSFNQFILYSNGYIDSRGR